MQEQKRFLLEGILEACPARLACRRHPGSGLSGFILAAYQLRPSG